MFTCISFHYFLSLCVVSTVATDSPDNTHKSQPKSQRQNVAMQVRIVFPPLIFTVFIVIRLIMIIMMMIEVLLSQVRGHIPNKSQECDFFTVLAIIVQMHPVNIVNNFLFIW